jgi:S-formylglutathione hydrolase FrmB
MARAFRLSVASLAAALVCAAPASAAQKLITIDAPSRYVDATKVPLQGPNHPPRLQANVLLPDGYDPQRRYPLLLLLHGAAGNWHSWTDPSGGDIRTTAKGLDAIVVMPDGGATGFYSDWWNGGKGGQPQWERYFRDELIPLIERRFPIRAGRRWHAIAGLSMGGYGTMYLASQLPGYFGSAIPMSGLVSTQRGISEIGIKLVANTTYADLWGPVGGFYATGHDPVSLTENLHQTRVDAYTGTGIPRPDRPPTTSPLSAPAELELWVENNELVAALRKAGARTTYTVTLGTHDWPYWRDDLMAAIKRGLFGDVPDDRTHWALTTVSRAGDAWGLRFSFATPPTSLVRFRRSGQHLHIEGSAGAVTIEDPGGCRLTAPVPAELELPAATCRRLKVRVAPARVRARVRRLVTVRVTEVIAGKAVAVAGARVRLGNRRATTGTSGRARFRIRPRRAGRVRVRAVKPGYRDGTTRVRVLSRP